MNTQQYNILRFTYLFLGLLFFNSCNNSNSKEKESKTESDKESILDTIPKIKEITDPKETEVWDPEPEAITFDENNIPSDAIVLFDGKNLDAWVSAKDSVSSAEWTITPVGVLVVQPGAGDIQTKKDFGSVQLHLEWKAPEKIKGEGQGRGNSGVFFQNRYEVQILDSYQNRTYANGQATSIYKQHIPLVNATKPSDTWQTYDIIFNAPEFDSNGKKITSGTFTVIHNGVLVQNQVEILGTTEYIGPPKNIAHGKAPIKLQDHSNPVHFRNIWVRELD